MDMNDQVEWSKSWYRPWGSGLCRINNSLYGQIVTLLWERQARPLVHLEQQMREEFEKELMK